jgi:hypothetical protein
MDVYLDRLSDRIRFSRHAVMLDERLKLQKIVLIFWIVFGFEYVIARKNPNAILGFPIRHGQEMGCVSFVPAKHGDTQVAWNGPIVRNGLLLKKACVCISF